MIRRLTLAVLFLATTTALFADPADGRRTFIVRNGKVISGEGDLFRRVYLGFSPLDVSSELREYLGAPKDGGVLVQSVKDGGPAAKAGLKVGDVVTAIDGKPVESAWNLGDLLDGKKAGDSVRLDVVRNRQRQTLVATLEERGDLPMKMRTLEIPELLDHLKIPELDHLKSMDGMPQMWRARVETTENCADLQARIHDLEARLKTLEKKLEK
jgi:membrane-associated protease RseP (regulator of RpoE activity)